MKKLLLFASLLSLSVGVVLPSGIKQVAPSGRDVKIEAMILKKASKGLGGKIEYLWEHKEGSFDEPGKLFVDKEGRLTIDGLSVFQAIQSYLDELGITELHRLGIEYPGDYIKE
ncbi:MAG: hypothetical protein P4L31_05025 [Candidatus Babeliales bacterium]|nr:hypothetical protein [Candidatus Babeliales bacterium]